MLKPELQVKFLHHLNRKKKDEGFTLIELLVVVIIIGVLAAIALPSLLNQVSKARQSEAKQNIGAINRAQQAYYLENANRFGSSIVDLAIGLKTASDNFSYLIDDGSTDNYAKAAVNIAAARAAKLKSYAGIVYTVDQTVGNITESLTQASLCEAKNAYNPAASVAVGTPEAVTAAAIATGNCNTMTPGMKEVN
ncbi:prepilin-type N-terminal cleavage/methylation domain-containing protein [Scytonema sp. UIC 10036]|uniref:type IV pilin-like G/H family protein n=1 Tax=Scytonema sp. UIC 10036 TaxID=2304196 RepID=UPI0012DA0662|nr:type IV pilin-like G/H family protein [Scytonema sp. UIC 10036]MUG97013.1 prepilin-type N-terminal cleavage/methylation domain-containing protein [Scytonema sp. UIC 10036]